MQGPTENRQGEWAPWIIIIIIIIITPLILQPQGTSLTPLKNPGSAPALYIGGAEQNVCENYEAWRFLVN